jgi:putative transposase
MKKISLIATQKVAYKVTTRRKHSNTVADNLLNQCFHSVTPNEIWAGDVTHLKTGEGWMYLAVVMDLYSRRIFGWPIDKRMTTELVSMAEVSACWDNAVMERFLGILKHD